jgi:hypothetical protein
MNTHTLRASPRASPNASPNASPLRWAAAAWFGVATLGQLFFAFYVLVFYGGSLLAGAPERWNRVAPHLYKLGDTLGNAALGSHVMLAVIVLAGGALQLTPWLRRTAPTLHRWNGRLYLGSVLLICLLGLYMTWIRGSVGDLTQHLGISLNAVLVFAFGTLAWRAAVAKRFAAHREWALRLYLAVAGVFFFRISLMAWVIYHRAPVGFDPHTFTGPFLSFLIFAQTLIPLAVLELYLRAQRSPSPATKTSVTVLLALLTVLTLLGIAAASLAMWLPKLR